MQQEVDVNENVKWGKNVLTGPYAFWKDSANFIRVSLFKISGLFMDPSIGEIRIYYKVTRIIVIDKKVNQNIRLWIKEILLTTRKDQQMSESMWPKNNWFR